MREENGSATQLTPLHQMNGRKNNEDWNETLLSSVIRCSQLHETSFEKTKRGWRDYDILTKNKKVQ